MSWHCFKQFTVDAEAFGALSNAYHFPYQWQLSFSWGSWIIETQTVTFFKALFSHQCSSTDLELGVISAVCFPNLCLDTVSREGVNNLKLNPGKMVVVKNLMFWNGLIYQSWMEWDCHWLIKWRTWRFSWVQPCFGNCIFSFFNYFWKHPSFRTQLSQVTWSMVL